MQVSLTLCFVYKAFSKKPEALAMLQEHPVTEAMEGASHALTEADTPAAKV